MRAQSALNSLDAEEAAGMGLRELRSLLLETEGRGIPGMPWQPA